jgi:hypothetical protein
VPVEEPPTASGADMSHAVSMYETVKFALMLEGYWRLHPRNLQFQPV